MEKLEKIKLEYMLFKEKDVLFPESVYCLLDFYHEEMDYSVKTSKKSINQNNRDYKIEKFKSAFLEFFGFENSYDWILEDNSFIEKQIGLAEVFDSYFSKLREKVTDDNFLDVSKLAQFTFEKYLNNFCYIESLRDGINLASSGITYYGREENDDKEFSEFFEEIFDNIFIKEKESKCIIKKDC